MPKNNSPVILVIDDEQAIRQSIRFFLEDYDFVIHEAENGKLGLDKFRELMPNLVLVDLRMPEVDGLEVLSNVTKESPETPIIVMSGTGVIGDAVEALHRGAWDYLFKPFEDLMVLQHSVEKALERTRLVKENREYQEHLEDQVAQRTQELEITTKELRQSEEKYRLLVENQNDMTVKLDTVGNLLFVSPSYCKTCGKSQEELLGNNFMPLIHEEDRHRVEEALKAVYHPPYSSYVEERAQTVDGWRWQAWQNTAVLDQNKNVTAIVSVGRDITKRKQVERERERLERAVEQASEIIIITDTTGTIIYVNPAFTTITGYSKEEAIGNNPRMLKSGKQPKVFYKDLWNTISKGNMWTNRLINRKKDGSLYTEIATITPIRSTSGKVVNFVGVKRDITGELKLEAQLQLAQKMEAIASLTGGIAHDFNNLLTVINGHAEIALIKAQKNDPVEKDVQAIMQAGEKAESLTRQLLTFSRNQIFKPKIIDINLVILDLEEILRRLISEDIHLELRFGKDIPSIQADPSQIEQILMNLVVNARDAVKEKKFPGNEKKITIETGRINLDKTFVAEHPGSKIGVHVCLAVNDNGIGMPLETQDKIFDPFFTTKDKGKGTGLGMSTVYGIVKQNKGSIFVYSEPGQGSTFKIFWPATDEQLLPTELINHEDDIHLKGRETILLVEDDEAVRNFAEDMLEDLGYIVFKAENGKKAIQLVEEKNIIPDLLLTDMIMPEMNGKELADYMMAKQPELKVLFSSGYLDSHIFKKGFLDEDVHFIQKPYSYQSLGRKLRKIING
jgi:PAS domain S-box-containing protein